MHPSDFPNPPGSFARVPGKGYAYIPAPLPPEIELDWGLVRLLTEAQQEVAELSGVGAQLPNPNLLIRPFLRREAVLSSEIEDTHASVEQLVLYEEDGRPSSSGTRDQVAEVGNYVKALDEGIRLIREEDWPIVTRLILRLHASLLSGVRGGDPEKTPGEYRRSPNWIGPPGSKLEEATYVPPPDAELHRLLSNWETYVNETAPEPVLVQAALMHYQFEAIHPFLDGNGRIGRLLITLLLLKAGVLSQPLLCLSGFFEETRGEYYRLLLGVSQRGDWKAWIAYFLRGVRQQARAAREDTRLLLELRERYREILHRRKRVPQEASQMLDQLFAGPILSIPRYSERYGVDFQATSKAVGFWEAEGVLREATGQKRNRLFLAEEILRLCEPRPAYDGGSSR